MTFRICGWPVEHLFDLQRYRVPWKTGCGIPISVIPASRPRLEFARDARRIVFDRRRIGFRDTSRHLPRMKIDRSTPVTRENLLEFIPSPSRILVF